MKTNTLLASLIIIAGSWLLAPAAACAQDAAREAITNKLNHIRFESFGPYDGLPLIEVVRRLDQDVKKRDPEKKGINLLINPNPPPSAPQIDPNTGLPVAAIESLDVNSVQIKIPSPLKDVSLADALNVIVLMADHPIQYTVEDYGVVFSAKGAGVSEEPKSSVPSAQEMDSAPPVVVKSVPEAGSKDVPPGEFEVKVTFSKEMADQSWSWSTAWQNSDPPSLGKPHYDADHRTCVMKVKLEPGKTYGWWINSQKFHGFQDTQGHPAIPYLLTFKVRDN